MFLQVLANGRATTSDQVSVMQAYADYDDMIHLTEDMVCKIAKDVLGDALQLVNIMHMSCDFHGLAHSIFG